MAGCLQPDIVRRAKRDASTGAQTRAGMSSPSSIHASPSEMAARAPPATAHVSQRRVVTAELLRTLAIFADTPDAFLRAVARVSILRHVARNVQVVRAGERTHFVYLIVSGELNVLAGDEQGREAILSVLGPGELFGEMGVLDDKVASATVTSVTAGDLLLIAKADFKRFMKEDFDFLRYVMLTLIQRLRVANRSIESLAFLDVTGRVARVLLDSAETVSGKQVVTNKISRQRIAKMIGASRERVSRAMKDMESRGLIEFDEGHVVLCDAGSR